LRSRYVKSEFFIQAEGCRYLSGPAHLELTRHLIEINYCVRFQAKGYSMSPFIREGDYITLSPLKEGSVGFGNVVAYSRKDVETMVVHRIVHIMRNLIITKGDSNPDNDDPVTRENIFGIVTRIERDGKRLFWGLGLERWLIAWVSRRKTGPGWLFRRSVA